MIPQVQREATATTSGQDVSWSLAERIGFRFVFSYVLLYLSPGAVGALGADLQLTTPYRQMWQSIWHAVVPWFGTQVLHLNGDFPEINNGSGDQLYYYVLLICIVILAVVVTAVWSLLDRRRKDYRTLYQWLRLFMRLVVGAAMIGYGVNKLFPMQFPEPPLARWIDPLGQMSPMGLLWTFMGLSRLYSVFGGIGEVTGGVLLFIPRFTTLGAIISFAMMSNVFLLNLSYDVPRKIYSIHLLLMCLFLILPDAKRLANVFIFNRATEPAPERPLFADKQLNSAALIFQFLFAIAVLGISGHDAYASARMHATHLPAPIRGIWSVESFTVNGVLQPPLLTDTQRWKQVVFDNPDVIIFQGMDDSLRQYPMRIDVAGKNFELLQPNGQNREATFRFEDPSPDRMTVEGEMDGHSIQANLSRVDLSNPSRFLLTNRGLHWINAYPYKR